MKGEWKVLCKTEGWVSVSTLTNSAEFTNTFLGLKSLKSWLGSWDTTLVFCTHWRKHAGRIIYLCESITSSWSSRHHLDSALFHPRPSWHLHNSSKAVGFAWSGAHHGSGKPTAASSIPDCPHLPPLPLASAGQGSAPRQQSHLWSSLQSACTHLLSSLLPPFPIQTQSYTFLCICSMLLEQSKDEHTAFGWHCWGDLKNKIIKKQYKVKSLSKCSTRLQLLLPKDRSGEQGCVSQNNHSKS